MKINFLLEKDNPSDSDLSAVSGIFHQKLTKRIPKALSADIQG
jgi:hypothetical protein